MCIRDRYTINPRILQAAYTKIVRKILLTPPPYCDTIAIYKPVSYTHLDVYKRQARKGSIPPHLVIIVYGVDYQGI